MLRSFTQSKANRGFRQSQNKNDYMDNRFVDYFTSSPMTLPSFIISINEKGNQLSHCTIIAEMVKVKAGIETQIF